MQGFEGLDGIPLSAMNLKHIATDVRVTSGIPARNERINGGFYKNSISLISKVIWAGKTLLAANFLNSAREKERCLLLAFKKSKEQLNRNAAGWGFDFKPDRSHQVLIQNINLIPRNAGINL